MTKRGRIAFSCVGIALLAALAWGAWPRTESVTEVTPDAPRMRCALEAGQTRAFRIVVTPSDSQGERTPLTAELHLRTLAGPSGTTQAADVAGMIVPHTDFEGAENYEEPFLLSVNTKCRFERISFTEATSATQAAVVEGTLRLFEVVGGDTRSPAWEVLQRDANGEYFASYQRSAFDETSLEFTRTSSDYRGPQGDGNSIQQLRFDMTGHFDAERGWLSRLTGESQHRVVMGRDRTDVSVRFELERIDAAPPAGLPGATDVALFVQTPQLGADPHGPPPSIAGMSRETIAAMEPGEMATRLLELFEDSDTPAREEAYQFLLAWVRTHPGGADALLDAIRRGELDARLDALALLVLGMADTPESRQALAGALTDTDLSAMNRQRAALALGSNSTPTMDSLNALRAAAEERGRSMDDTVTRGVMMRSVGPMARDDAPEDVREEARQYIRELASSADLEDRLAGLDAAGNAGSEALLDAIEPGFEHGEPTIRASAYNALRDMPRDLIQPVITDALRHETHGDVRRALVAAAYTNANAAARPYVDPLLAQAAVATLASTPDEGARMATIGLAGIANDASPEVHAALLAWMEHEEDPNVIQVLGRYLSVEEARAAIERRRAAGASGTR
jgi:hypothetical protein